MNNTTNRKIISEEHHNNLRILAGNNFELIESSEPMKSRNNTFKHKDCDRLFSIHNSKLINLFKENKALCCPYCVEK